MHRNRSVDTHKFSMIPRADIPRSKFIAQKTHKTTFDSGSLIPIYVDEVLPGDTVNLSATMFARMATPLYPIMDNLHMDTFFFFVPNRLVWDNWQKFMGEQKKPGDSTDYLIPTITSPVGGYEPLSISDYMGLPTVGQVDAESSIEHSALWHRAYALIWNEWFRDQNLQDPTPFSTDDGPDEPTDYKLLRRGKRHDYFTSALPWPQKGESVALPLGGQAAIGGTITSNEAPIRWVAGGADSPIGYSSSFNGIPTTWFKNDGNGGQAGNVDSETIKWGSETGLSPEGLYADLSEATAATINQLRQAFQIQKLLERDARGGTRYTEIIRSHFGVTSPDARLQRPEYLGGGSTSININPIAQTSSSTVTASTTPLGTLAAMGTALASGHGFSQSFTEHGLIIGLVAIRADLTYQQGLHKMWSRQTRYDFYFPAFAHLGEQAILNKEIYATGTATDEGVFGYQERWAEYRHKPSQISGLFKSTTAGTLDGWHLAQHFTGLPTLNNTFIEDRPPMERVLAVGASAQGQEFIFDGFFDVKMARPMPMYSVPGLIDHF
jgi:hypothetical protein